jgi:uncharacterized repeat protein (TIGR03943 family)
MVAAVNRRAQGVVLMLLGGAALRASLTDMYLRYVKESLQPFLVAASVLLVVAGAMTLWYELRPGRKPEADADGHGEPRVGWLLIAPVLGLLLVAPPALGSYSVTTAGTSLPEDQPSAGFPPLPEVSLVELTVLDYAARAIWDGGRSMAGRRVQLTGFLITGEDGRQYLARLVLNCCAADARPIKVGMAGDVPEGLSDDTWVELIGGYVAQTGVDPINEATIPYLAVEHWREIPAPSSPYE